MYEIIANQCFI